MATPTRRARKWLFGDNTRERVVLFYCARFLLVLAIASMPRVNSRPCLRRPKDRSQSNEVRRMMTTLAEQGLVETDCPQEGAGCEWIVDASGCSCERLRSLESVRAICERAVRELELQVVGQPLWRQFPDPGGVTGLYLLSESHLACHTWPELGLATFNLFSCRRRGDWPWETRLCEMLGADVVSVRIAERGIVGAEVVEVLEGATA